MSVIHGTRVHGGRAAGEHWQRLVDELFRRDVLGRLGAAEAILGASPPPSRSVQPDHRRGRAGGQAGTAAP